MTTLADLERVERELREQFHFYCDDVETASVARHIERAANTISEYIAAQSSVAATSEWQPIETAPKDGRVVLMCDAHGNRWTALSDDFDAACTYPPVYWMPLPPPPKKENSDG